MPAPVAPDLRTLLAGAVLFLAMALVAGGAVLAVGRRAEELIRQASDGEIVTSYTDAQGVLHEVRCASVPGENRDEQLERLARLVALLDERFPPPPP